MRYNREYFQRLPLEQTLSITMTPERSDDRLFAKIACGLGLRVTLQGVVREIGEKGIVIENTQSLAFAKGRWDTSLFAFRPDRREYIPYEGILSIRY